MGEEVEVELNDLNLAGARFSVSFNQPMAAADTDGKAKKKIDFKETGLDEVEFLIAPNPGEGLKPLVKIASGGETSRLMLALKNVLAQADHIPTLIFDEIDQGIGGRVGFVVGEKMWQLARRHQVMCVTHLPQLAAFGDEHYKVSKSVVGERTLTHVAHLVDEDRIFELALMNGNTSESNLAAAREILGRAHEKQAKVLNQPAGTKPMTTPKLNILLLGPPEILLEGKPVLIKRRLNRALLFYLAAQQYPVTRDEVCGLFWPEEPEESARKNLREALSRLRTTLGLHDLLISDGEQLSLNSALVRVDYREIDKLISPLMSSSEMNSSGTLPEWVVTQLKTGLALCRTDRFMQGMTLSGADGFVNWLELTNQGYRYAMVKVIDRLVDHNISGGNLEEALMWLGKAIHLNPYEENWNYLTLICLRDTGKVNEMIEFTNYLERLYLQQQEPFPQRFTDLKKEAIQNKNLKLSAAADWPEEEDRGTTFHRQRK